MWIAIPFRSLGSPAPAIVLKPWTKFTDVFLSGKSKGFHLSWLGLGCCSFQSWLRWSPYALKFLSYEMNHVTQLTWTGPSISLANNFNHVKYWSDWQLIIFKWVGSLWHYGLWSFQAGSTKLERFLHKNQHTQRKLLNLEFWINGELSKTGHHYRNKVIKKLILSKNVNNKKRAPKLEFFNEKKGERFRWFLT